MREGLLDTGLAMVRLAGAHDISPVVFRFRGATMHLGVEQRVFRSRKEHRRLLWCIPYGPEIPARDVRDFINVIKYFVLVEHPCPKVEYLYRVEWCKDHRPAKGLIAGLFGFQDFDGRISEQDWKFAGKDDGEGCIGCTHCNRCQDLYDADDVRAAGERFMRHSR